MKITDYQRVTSLLDNDIFLVDGVNGTKTIKTSDLTKEIDRRGNIWDTLDDYIPVELRRNIWRGKNLGNLPTESDYDEIGAGTFNGLYLGDYWLRDNVVYRIVDFNYWLGTGDSVCSENHLVIMTDGKIANARMNDTNSTSGGYVNSKMRTSTIMNDVEPYIIGVFGEEHILNHRELLVSAVTNGRPSSGTWYNSKVEIPNEIMMYGSYILTPGSTGEFVSYRFTVNKTQLSAMLAYPKLINPKNESLWLRDVVSSNEFASISIENYSDRWDAASMKGVRPVFGIKKAS